MTVLLADRWHFAFTITYHYLFPQLTMGLALLIFVLKTVALRTGSEKYNRAALLWRRSSASTSPRAWSQVFRWNSNSARTGRDFLPLSATSLDQTLAMEGVFAFFLESTFLGLFLYGATKIGPRTHWLASLLVFAGSWISGWFIIATNAWMQNPVGYRLDNGAMQLQSFWALKFNPWFPWQYLHNMCGATAARNFVIAGIEATTC